MAAMIAKIETWIVRYPVAGYFKFFEGPRGTAPGRPAVLVRVTDDQGNAGWGQSVPAHRWSYETVETVQTTIERYLAPELIGMDPGDEDAIRQAMDRIIAPSFSRGQPIAKAGIDLALFDLVGRREGRSAAQRWSRSGRERIELSWTINSRSLEEAGASMDQGLARGYRSFNVKVAPDPAFDLALCRRARERLGDGFIWADANGGYDLDTALAVAPGLADLGLAALEQPLPANQLTGLRRLRRQGALPIVLDEPVVSTSDLEEFLRLEVLDGVAMKVARTGGLAEARRMVELVLDRGLLFLGSGLTDPDLSLAASLLLFGCYDLPHPAALNGPQYLVGSVLSDPWKLEGGALRVPQGPGLGVQVDPDRLHAMGIRWND